MMRFIFLVLVLPFFNGFSQKPFNKQKLYFPTEIENLKLYLGKKKKTIPKKYLSPKAHDKMDDHERHLLINVSKRVDSLVYYVDHDDDKPICQIILFVNDKHDAQSIIKEKLGPLLEGKGNNHWAFEKEESGLDIQIGIWTFKNRIIFAGAIPKTKWERGVP